MKNAQGQFRVPKDALESRTKMRAEGGHHAALWMVMRAATVTNKGRRDDEGFTAHRRWKGREFARPVTEFGEIAMYLPAASVGRNKFDVRRDDGVWLGIKMESGQSILGIASGDAKARDLWRKPRGGNVIEQRRC